jgi:hypothetical protein
MATVSSGVLLQRITKGCPRCVTIAYNMKAKLSRVEVIATFSTRIAKEVPDQGNPSLVSI